LKTIIVSLLLYIQIQWQLINYLMVLVVGKNINLKDKIKTPPVNQIYAQMQIDSFPKLETIELLDYKKLLAEYLHQNGKELKPVRRHKNSKNKVPNTITCPYCGAPHIYLYDNNGGEGQFLCKVCSKTFNYKIIYSKAIKRKCPFCDHTLVKIKERKEFDIYKCKNDDCSYYKVNLSLMTKDDKKRFEKAPFLFKVRYIYREFKYDFKPLSNENLETNLPTVDISRIHCSAHTLGLILTYYVNYGLSSRKTAAIMMDIHQLKISHQTVLNYADAVSSLIKPFVDDYPYELSNSYCGDETYLKVKGKWQYLFFFFDSVKKIILSYRLSPQRDTLSAIKALNDVLLKIKTLPNDLAFIVDGNPIYLLAQHYFAQHGIHFDIHRVIGLTNEDPISTEYRPLKEIIERLNRTFKRSYKTTTGFKSSAGSIAFINLFVAYFNFLRPHSALEKKVPVLIPELDAQPHMPARWGKLIELAQEHIIILQQSA
jgi:transposase-like protein/transcription elongation factor Elf1